MTTTTVVYISKGPASSDFIDALKYAYDKNNPHTVKFTSDKNHVFEVRITSITHEDGSGKKFNFRGYIVFPEKVSERMVIQGYYNASTQTGRYRRVE